MLANLFALLFFASIVSIITFIFRRNKKKVFISIGMLLVSLVLFGLTSADTIRLTFDESKIETNQDGFATVVGKTNKKAKVTLANQPIKVDDDGVFYYEVQLTENKDKALIFESAHKKDSLTKTIMVKPSASFKTKLAQEAAAKKLAQEKKILALAKDEAEKKVASAEKKPTQENYDTAYTLVAALTSGGDELEKRLQKVAELITKEKEAESALALAEKSPNQKSYDTAKLAISAFPGETSGLLTRLSGVNDTILANKQKAELQEAKIQEEKSQEAQLQALNKKCTGNI